MINNARQENGVAKLTQTADANKAATARAKEIVTKFSHTRPNGDQGFYILDKYGVAWMTAGENIAKGQTSEESVFDAWMNSPLHKENMLDGDFSKFGLGHYEKDGVDYWVLLLYA